MLTRLVWPAKDYRGDNSGAKQPAPGIAAPVPLRERSTALRTLLVRFGAAGSPGALESTFARGAPSFWGYAFMAQQRSGSYPRGIFTKVDPREMLRRNPPIYFQRNLEHMIVIARHHDIQPVLATFASTAREKGGDASSSEEIRFGLDQTNGVVRSIGRKLDVPVFDFAGEFPQDPKLFVGGVHLNEKGARLKAKLFADYLLESDLIRQPTP